MGAGELVEEGAGVAAGKWGVTGSALECVLWSRPCPCRGACKYPAQVREGGVTHEP
jgi:hypothetical protein